MKNQDKIIELANKVLSGLNLLHPSTIKFTSHALNIRREALDAARLLNKLVKEEFGEPSQIEKEGE